MKIIVDKLPSDASECMYCEKRFNPPFIEEPYSYICRFGKTYSFVKSKYCNLSDGCGECYGLKELQ